MNASKSVNDTFKPKQAIAPTPQLYVELVGDAMEILAKASLSQISPIPTGAIIHDNGCGAGGASAAIMEAIYCPKDEVTIKGTDINEGVLEIYKRRAADNDWPVEAVKMDARNLTSFGDNTFSHSIASALLIFLPNEDVAIDAVKEMYRTLKPGGTMLVNTWAYIPNLVPIQTAAKVTRPVGVPLPRQGQEKWEAADFVRDIVEKGGFEKEKITLTTVEVPCATAELTRFATMAWSFIGGTSEAGWLESDEENWDRAVDVVKEELKKTKGFKMLDGGKAQIRFVANVCVATK